jgi:hypothetical protein
MTEQPAPTDSRRARGRLLVGIVLLLVGCLILASNLGLVIPDWWNYWPWLLILLGASQFVWPGSFRERMFGYWLVVVGGVAAVSQNEWFGLDWSDLWPVFIIAAGVRVILGGMSRHLRD